MNLNECLNKLESLMKSHEPPEEIFHRYCTGEYDHSKNLTMNLMSARVPLWLMPEELPEPILEDRMG